MRIKGTIHCGFADVIVYPYCRLAFRTQKRQDGLLVLPYRENEPGQLMR